MNDWLITDPYGDWKHWWHSRRSARSPADQENLSEDLRISLLSSTVNISTQERDLVPTS